MSSLREAATDLFVREWRGGKQIIRQIDATLRRLHNSFEKDANLRERNERNLHDLLEAHGQNPMKRNRRRKVQRALPNNVSHATHHVAERELLGAQDSHSLL